MIKQGVLFLLTYGQYSNYEVITACRANQDIDILALKEEYLMLYPNEREKYEFKRYKFVKWLIVDKKVADELEYAELYIGEYGLLEPEISDHCPGEGYNDLLDYSL